MPWGKNEKGTPVYLRNIIQLAVAFSVAEWSQTWLVVVVVVAAAAAVLIAQELVRYVFLSKRLRGFLCRGGDFRLATSFKQNVKRQEKY